MEIAPKFQDRNGGYTRVLKKGFRQGDGAPVSIIELVGLAKKEKVKKEASEKKSEKKAEKKEEKTDKKVEKKSGKKEAKS